VYRPVLPLYCPVLPLSRPALPSCCHLLSFASPCTAWLQDLGLPGHCAPVGLLRTSRHKWGSQDDCTGVCEQDHELYIVQRQEFQHQRGRAVCMCAGCSNRVPKHCIQCIEVKVTCLVLEAASLKEGTCLRTDSALLGAVLVLCRGSLSSPNHAVVCTTKS
jgi:hypothetical protein